MEEILIFIAKFASIVLGIAVIAFSWAKLPNIRLKIFFAAMIAGFSLPTLFFAEEEVWASWIKHFLFYGGQIFFIAFISQSFKFFNQLNAAAPPNKPENKPRFAGVAGSIPILSQIDPFFRFLVEQGLQHIFTVFLAIFALSYMRVRSSVTDFKGRSFPFWPFAAAMIVLTLLHAAEFFIESQKILVLPHEIFELLEFAAIYAGLILLGVGSGKFSRL